MVNLESGHTRKGSLHIGVLGCLRGCSVALLVWEDDFCMLALKLMREAVFLMVVATQNFFTAVTKLTVMLESWEHGVLGVLCRYTVEHAASA